MARVLHDGTEAALIDPGTATREESAAGDLRRIGYRRAMEEAGEVPVEIVGLRGLLGLPEVLDVTATLRLVDDVTANPDLVRLLTSLSSIAM